ncbi:MAG: integrase [Devosia sp. 67-54]|uniref:tyrosine-type recombinase/integrase n=1 Tax=unclassified Devosia TaxID=196773 RepID=UPI00095CE15A|nr:MULTISPECIES: site-specific integrase [unclassified Devosia]MBN9306841.1 integrase arm-type DNA-binding domain-containing protein [Devosia sp.]OJX17053.1 MAG: integrase [Devosia sp. 67-54]
MGRERERLSAVEVRQKPAGKYADGDGLWLIKTAKDRGNWVLRLTIHGRQRYMGLGSIAKRSLADARKEAARWRTVALDGLDPIAEREREMRDKKKGMTLLRDIAREAFDARKASLRGGGKAGRWYTPIEQHVLPKLGDRPIAGLTQVDIEKTLRPIWQSKADTAHKALTRLGMIFDYAAAHDLKVDRDVVAKARTLLGDQVHQVENIPAMPWAEVPAFYASLSDGSTAHLALRLLILTVVRSRPLRFIHESQISGNVWTVPAGMMKGREGKAEEFRVALSSEALKVIDQARARALDGFLFPNVRKGVISDATMIRLMERRGMVARPHGFRASMRTWLSEATDAPHAVAETILQHKVAGSVEAAYNRTKYIEQRRIYMERWANFVTGKADADVVRLVQTAA